MRLGDTPVPIPNTVVKLFSAENTWRAAAREDKATPTFFIYITGKREQKTKFNALPDNIYCLNMLNTCD